MPEEPSDSGQRIARLAACAALDSGLRSILCFDHDPEAVLEMAATLSEAVQIVEGRPVERFVLSSSSDEDGLWTRITWGARAGAPELRLVPGPLAPAEDGSASSVVVISDLARLSLPAARACVMLVGADIAYLERHGRSAQWRPRNCWIAACPSEQVGAVSPHLLDRFAIRLAEREPSRRVARIEAMIAAAAGARVRSLPPPPRPFEGVDVEKALAMRPKLTSDARVRLLTAGVGSLYGMRRQIAVARVAVAEARLAGHERVEVEDVDRAIGLLQLDTPPPSQAATAEPEIAIDLGPTSQQQPEPPDVSAAQPQTGTFETGPPSPADGASVLAADTESALEPSMPAVGSAAVYPEDDAPVKRDPEPLRFPQRQRGGTTVPSGVVVGVEPAAELRDIAVLPSVVEALKLQPARRRLHPDAPGRLLLAPGDLRSYIRAPAPETMLALLLDYTCRGDWDWTGALMPFLRWAYIHRATISLAKVGAREAASEFRAERIRARSLLDPGVAASLDCAPGRATPLAHGLELTLHALVHGLHHGTGAVQEAWLVVVSDGRGNVPLAASVAGTAPSAAGRRGIDDALAVAKRIAALDRLRVAVIDPEPAQCSDLPQALARALGATVFPRTAEPVADVA